MPIIGPNILRGAFNLKKCSDKEIEYFGKNISAITPKDISRLESTFQLSKRLEKAISALLVLSRSKSANYSNFKEVTFQLIDERPNKNFKGYAIWPSKKSEFKFGLCMLGENGINRFKHINNEQQFKLLMTEEKLLPNITGSKEINFFNMKISDEIRGGDVAINNSELYGAATDIPSEFPKIIRDSENYTLVDKPKKVHTVDNAIQSDGVSVAGDTDSEESTYVNWEAYGKNFREAPPLHSAEHTYAIFGQEGQYPQMVGLSEMAKEDNDDTYSHLSDFTQRKNNRSDELKKKPVPAAENSGMLDELTQKLALRRVPSH